MAPKLLTDCPENLREAIDWLVQVRHCGGVSTVSDALATLFDNVAQDAEKSLPSLPDPDRPSARDVVSKLRAFQSTLPKDSANPNKNIIHNLCASAASLLGYRYPGTYDGSGIVYGNASRLCDAILAFLYAVFIDVHDNQPYVAGRSVLHDVIVQLKSQLWCGHKGFCQVIPKVATGLQRYNAAVKASNDKVKKPIETVLRYVKPGGELRRGIHALQITEVSTSAEDAKTVESAVSLVEGCKEVARVFSKSLTAAKDAIDDLNPKLKRKLENARRSFFNHVDWLSKWSKKGEKEKLDKMIQKIKSRLRSLAKAVKDKIKQEVHTVVELLKKRVREIRIKLEGITGSLEEYVKELGQWMDDAKKYIKDVKKYVDDIMKQLDGDNRKKIDEAAADIDSQLGKKVGELNQWIEKAEAAVKAAKDKAEEVHRRLDKDDKNQKIRQGIEKISKAVDAVSGVNTQLLSVHNDLTNWKNEAQTVLGIAIGNAVAVHTALDPTKYEESHIIGQKLKAIDDAKKELDTANDRLRIQVESLNKWIDSAEKIRAAAETKAKEAYDKLSVHEKLSENVKKIMDAKEKIDEVHGKLKGVDSQLVTWSDQAEKVLEGAIKNAEYVHERLKDGEVVDRKIKEIGTNNASIVKANKDLESEVQHLGKWKDAAGKVIEMADKKCDEILKRVDKNHNGNEGGRKGPEIYKQALELQDKGKMLLEAANEAKRKVEQNVKSALDAVKEMDADLKKDLKEVKDKIKEGIKDVIKNSGVDQLGEKVKQDLQKLRGNIEKLKDQVKDTSNGMLQGQLKALGDAKTPLTEMAKNIKEQKLKEMDQQFKSAIQDLLEKNVEEVYKAIEELSKNMGVTGVSEADKKKLQKIFEHIKGKVADIKGKEGRDAFDSNSKGLDGIVKSVKVLAETYQGSAKFLNKVNGFVMEILRENKIVQGMLKKYATDSGLKEDYTMFDRPADSIFSKDIAEAFQTHLKTEADAAGQKADEKIREAERSVEKIKGYITAVKEGLTTFVDKVEEKLKVTDVENLENKINETVNTIVSQIEGAVNKRRNTHQTTNSADFKLIAKRILMKLIVTVRKVAGEVRVLGISVFGKIIDEIKPTVDGLHSKLEGATSSGKTTATGTAKAVDDAIKGVKDMVESTISKKFDQVKEPVNIAVKDLEKAVESYDTKAKQQVKAAAKAAIDKAANEISRGSDVKLAEAMGKMPSFKKGYEPIKDGLEKQLRNEIDKSMGYDGWTSTVEVSKTLTNYKSHIDRDSLTSTNSRKGKLPEAIEEIGSEGLDALTKLISGGDSKIDAQNFEVPFRKIESELDEVKKLVDGDGLDIWHNNDNKGIKKYLELFKRGLGNTVQWNPNGISVDGLQHIIKSIESLQKDTFDSKPAEIGKAVEAIRNEVEELKSKLKSDGNPKDGVINQLTDLQSKGLAGEKWNGKDGLKKIQEFLQEQNKILPEQTEGIRKAITNIKGEIAKVGLKFQNIFTDNDILDNLRTLGRKIGKGRIKDGNNLLKILTNIGGLQQTDFTNNPSKINDAKEAIVNELKRLRDVLEGEKDKDVIVTLKDLRDNGFGHSDKWNGHNAKGFDHIKSNLERQQRVLTDQPGQVELGMKDITEELQSIRDDLDGKDLDDPGNRGVVKNLEFMIQQIGNKDNEGLKNIKTEIESLNRSQVPLITQNLNTMSSAITNAAGQLGLNLNQLENPHIDGKLKGIQDNLNNLRLNDLAAAIKMCDDFLDKADEIERNTIDALLKHVDDEVDDAIKDLTKEARGLYVDSVKEALEMFARKVNEDLEQLPNEINRDRYMGYKGFMRYLQGPLISALTGDEQSVAELSSAFQEVLEQTEKYVSGEITRLHDEQNKEKNPLLPPTVEPYTPKLNDVYEALTELLVYLRDNDGGADKLTELVERMTKTQSNLVPSDFKHPSTPLLDTVSRGLSKFAGEFHNTYISTYSGQRCREEHSHKYAKVLLSMVPMTYTALTKLMMKCAGKWKHLHITEFTAEDRDNALGNYLTKCGYRVSSFGSEQDGQLNNMFTGAGIHELLATPIEDVDVKILVDGEQVKNGINFVTIISLLYNLLCHYFQVCHIPVPLNARYPCTVRDILSWLSGLQYTQVADKLPEHCKALLNRRCHDGDTPNREDQVMAKCIGELPYIIATTCSRSTALLTAIQGNGHGFDLAAYPYSVDFSNNRAKLHYPNDPAELLDMLREITCRLCKVLYFLYSQCCRSTARVKGWRECTYGRQVQSHNWQCQQIGTYSSAISTTTATITSSTTHGCPPTSPLQSFLADCCRGLLPHTLTATNMAIECANCTANLPGQQCLTPLGFWDLSFAASISGTGWDLAKRLGDMCRDADSCLFVLCRTLFYLCPAAPSSLADVFALYAQVLRQWDPHDRVNHRGGTYTDASGFISHLNTDGIDSLFPLWKELHGSYDNHKLTSAIASLTDHDHKSHDALSSLVNDTTCKPPSGCGPYIQPLGLHAHHTYPQKHAGLYITWIVHLAWQFWELLQHLLHALDNIDCTASGCATCPCQLGTHGGKDTCHCPSIVQCAGLLPTLYRYGFTYRNANMLVTDNPTVRCGDLNTQLKEALHSAHFTELFRQIDQLIWHIRMPFLYFLIALWTITALYILHTFLYRIDILRIRSHLLTTTASHLIDVKALLIPSRKMLSLYDASYFDDDPAELLDAT